MKAEQVSGWQNFENQQIQTLDGGRLMCRTNKLQSADSCARLGLEKVDVSVWILTKMCVKLWFNKLTVCQRCKNLMQSLSFHVLSNWSLDISQTKKTNRQKGDFKCVCFNFLNSQGKAQSHEYLRQHELAEGGGWWSSDKCGTILCIDDTSNTDVSHTHYLS